MTMSSSLSPTSTNPLSSSSSSSYKGKTTNRSWSQLPPDLVRTIVTFFVWDLRSHHHTPSVWEAHEHWQQRMMYVVLRDVPEIMKIMAVCPAWGVAIEHHAFWESARSVIDPQNCFQQFAFVKPPQSSLSSSALAGLIPVSAFHHYNRICHISCHVCRVNAPWTSFGLGSVKRQLFTPTIGTIFVCRDHRKGTFCGLCLRTIPLPTPEAQLIVGIHENEDDETWPGVDATCRSCRAEWLWKRVAQDPWLREAVGGRGFDASDWESRFVIDGFVDNADGTINDVLVTCSEKLWLRKNTRFEELLRVAVLSTRYNLRHRNLRDDDDEEAELDDPELLSITEEREGVRDLALSDWARTRIMDGHWLSPADSWYKHVVAGRPTHVQAVHPCPWTDDTVIDHLDNHPQESIVKSTVPPTFHSCEQAFRAFGKQMRSILKPAMENIVRKLVIECTADGIDPAVKAARMQIEEVAAELREEGVWYNGMDWLEHRKNTRAEANKRRHDSVDDGAESDSSSSSKSDATSPVLSTTTVQTTPSPPPSSSGKESEEDSPNISRSRRTIPVTPVLNPPVLLPHIPFVPITTQHLPSYSAECLKSIWREACVPLYHCRCRICERAMSTASAAAVAASAPVATPAAVPTDPAIVKEQQEQYHRLQQQTQAQEERRQALFVQVKLDPADETVVNEGEVNSDCYSDDDLSSPLHSSEDGFVSDDEDISQQTLEPAIKLRVSQPTTQSITQTDGKTVWRDVHTHTPRKRSCDEVDDCSDEPDAEGEIVDDENQALPLSPANRTRIDASHTPPKRAKLELSSHQDRSPSIRYPSSEDSDVTSSTLKKRGSEELESDDRHDTIAGEAPLNGFKKAKLDDSCHDSNLVTSRRSASADHTKSRVKGSHRTDDASGKQTPGRSPRELQKTSTA